MQFFFACNWSSPFTQIFLMFPQGFRRVSEGFPGFPQVPWEFPRIVRVSMAFAWVSACFQWVSQMSCSFEFAEGFPRFLQVSLGTALFGRFAEPQASKSWRKVITVVVRRYAKSYIFVETNSGARNKCALQLKERVVKKAQMVFEITAKLTFIAEAGSCLPRRSLSAI